MIPSIYDVYWKNLSDLEKIRAQFFKRLAVLADAAVQSAEERAARLNAHCSVPALSQYRYVSDVEGFFSLADAQAKIATECGEAYLAETRNFAQVTMLTQDEIWVWLDRLFKGWSKLASSTAQTHA